MSMYSCALGIFLAFFIMVKKGKAVAHWAVMLSSVAVGMLCAVCRFSPPVLLIDIDSLISPDVALS